ncbi:trans-aconitate 2-methyltransferase [Phenylobacterium sp.]|jgi:trans-aconitate methyltransferase|uniref:class I SAM-dependent methyltransferase n=1 Tax=Phenylobacterium sp. TaxID=1871053 RepID=UPI0025F6F51C|nr:class I SAM-dependent methyltransferase [Phenylobacterium sp.]|tara:strand:- start:267 stop:986 length:720 start_codon:yes stop_codon:yes gene_type:complete
MDWDAFFAVHRDLRREGPGLAEDVAWVGGLIGISPQGQVCDAGCGPGGDLAALRQLVPEGRIDGFEMAPHFVDAARKRFAGDPSVRIFAESMEGLTGPYDLIWSAGAVYFLGVARALNAWRGALSDQGAVAFSHPCLFTDAPSKAALAFWEAEPGGIETELTTRDEIAAVGWRVLAARPLSDAAWAAYYEPIEARCDALEAAGVSEAVAAAIAAARKEASDWRTVARETGYMLYVVRPV